jgi:hypothetical protein
VTTIDDRADAQHEARVEANRKATALVVTGKGRVEQRGGSKAVRVGLCEHVRARASLRG